MADCMNSFDPYTTTTVWCQILALALALALAIQSQFLMICCDSILL